MTAAELLKPRYELIATYPDYNRHQLYVGAIVEFQHFNDETKQWYNVDSESTKYDAYYDQYPHLFKKLNWWEYRKVQDMPKRLICKALPNDKQVIEIEEWDLNNLVGWISKKKLNCCSLLYLKPQYGYFPVD